MTRYALSAAGSRELRDLIEPYRKARYAAETMQNKLLAMCGEHNELTPLFHEVIIGFADVIDAIGSLPVREQKIIDALLEQSRYRIPIVSMNGYQQESA